MLNNFWLNRNKNFTNLFMRELDKYLAENDDQWPKYVYMRRENMLSHWDFFKFVVKTGMTIRIHDNCLCKFS